MQRAIWHLLQEIVEALHCSQRPAPRLKLQWRLFRLKHVHHVRTRRRKKCIDSIGGWNSRTTVEDMDLSLRSYVGGWRAIFLEDITCLNEVASLSNPDSVLQADMRSSVHGSLLPHENLQLFPEICFCMNSAIHKRSSCISCILQLLQVQMPSESLEYGRADVEAL